MPSRLLQFYTGTQCGKTRISLSPKKKIREINSLVTSLVKTLVSWNICQTLICQKLRNFTTTLLLQKFRESNFSLKNFTQLIWRKKFCMAAVNFSFFDNVVALPIWFDETYWMNHFHAIFVYIHTCTYVSMYVFFFTIYLTWMNWFHGIFVYSFRKIVNQIFKREKSNCSISFPFFKLWSKIVRPFHEKSVQHSIFTKFF